MSQKSYPDFIHRFIHFVRRHGAASLPAYLAWLARTATEKLLIRAQDRLGGNGYTRWLRENETKNKGRSQSAVDAGNITFIEIFDPSSPTTTDAVRRNMPNCLSEWVVFCAKGDWFSDDLADSLGRIEADVVYWDEDVIDKQGKRSEPFFKPDWSPEMWLSVDLLHRAAVRRDYLQQNLNEADLFSALVLNGGNIAHIPKVLSHSQAPGWKETHALARHQRSVKDYLSKIGFQKPNTALRPDGSLRVTWESKPSLISVIIPTRNHLELIQPCLDGLFQRTDWPSLEVILVDNGSDDAAVLDYYQKMQSLHEHLRIIAYPGEFNFSRALNLGAQAASGEILLFLNNDVEILHPAWMAEMARFTEIPGVGAVGAKLLYPDQTIQHCGIILGLEGHASHIFMGMPDISGGIFGSTTWYRDLQAVTGACMMIRNKIFHEIGGFDEHYRLAFSDIEIGVRLNRSGYRVALNPDAALIHHEGGSRGKYIPENDIALAYHHFKDIVARGDGYFNLNLSTAWRQPTFRRCWEQNSLARLQSIVKYS